MDRIYLPVLYGTVREPRHSFGVARFVVREVGQRASVETRLFDPRDLPAGNLVERAWEQEEPPAALAEFTREMDRADGFLIVTPEYNFGLPGTLKNLLDYLYDEWNRKPFGVVTAGGVSGGIRAGEQLREVVAGLGGITVPAYVAVHAVQEAFDEEGPRRDAELWSARIRRLVDELEWYARALRVARYSPPPGELRLASG